MSVSVRIVCPACGGDEWRFDLVAGEHRLLRCTCGLRTLDRAVDRDAALHDNENMYGAEEYNAWYRTMQDRLTERYRADLDEIESMTGGRGRILDVGCSYGWFLQTAASRGWETTGIEATDATARDAREAGLDVRTGTIEDAGLPEASYDVVCLWDVLEHVPAVDSFIGEIHRVLKPGGLLAVNSPNIDSVMARQAGADWSWLLLPHHVWQFTPGSMRATLQSRGFAVERLRTWEPTEAFVENLMLYKRRPRLGSKPVRRVTDKLLVAAEKAWCRAGRGGLIRAYARRTP